MTSTVKIIIGIIAVIVVLLIIFAIARDDVNDIINDVPRVNDEVSDADQVLDQLPRQVTVEERTITFDTTTIEREDRDEYAQRPAPMPILPGEDPVEYIERYLVNLLAAEHIREQAEFFEFSASFYERNGGISAFVRVENIPDDAIGAGEERFDFVLTNNTWTIDWYGERVFCRRLDAEFWQPADQLCP